MMEEYSCYHSFRRKVHDIRRYHKAAEKESCMEQEGVQATGKASIHNTCLEYCYNISENVDKEHAESAAQVLQEEEREWDKRK